MIRTTEILLNKSGHYVSPTHNQVRPDRSHQAKPTRPRTRRSHVFKDRALGCLRSKSERCKKKTKSSTPKLTRSVNRGWWRWRNISGPSEDHPALVLRTARRFQAIGRFRWIVQINLIAGGPEEPARISHTAQRQIISRPRASTGNQPARCIVAPSGIRRICGERHITLGRDVQRKILREPYCVVNVVGATTTPHQ